VISHRFVGAAERLKGAHHHPSVAFALGRCPIVELGHIGQGETVEEIATIHGGRARQYLDSAARMGEALELARVNPRVVCDPDLLVLYM
jgi:hypothetical protein